MTLKRKISIAILILICAFKLLFVFEVFLMSSSGNIIHGMELNVYLGTAEMKESSPAIFSVFYFTSIIAISAILLSLSAGILFLIFGPIRKGKKWALSAIFAMFLVWLIPANLIYYGQPNGTWFLWMLFLGLVLISLNLEFYKNKI